MTDKMKAIQKLIAQYKEDSPLTPREIMKMNMVEYEAELMQRAIDELNRLTDKERSEIDSVHTSMVNEVIDCHVDDEGNFVDGNDLYPTEQDFIEACEGSIESFDLNDDAQYLSGYYYGMMMGYEMAKKAK